MYDAPTHLYYNRLSFPGEVYIELVDRASKRNNDYCIKRIHFICNNRLFPSKPSKGATVAPKGATNLFNKAKNATEKFGKFHLARAKKK